MFRQPQQDGDSYAIINACWGGMHWLAMGGWVLVIQWDGLDVIAMLYRDDKYTMCNFLFDGRIKLRER
jgi:hypothetical protein